MRAWCLLIAAVLLLGWGGVASARKECRTLPSDTSVEGSEETEHCTVARRRNECKVLENQLKHFERVVELAQERDDELWEQATVEHIKRLRARQIQRNCPAIRKPGVINALVAFLTGAADLALTILTLGAL